jgi:small subunit ribosomal protein S6
MRTYETLVLLSPELGTENRQEVVDALTGIISREGGHTVTADQWPARELAYPVRKFTRGYYVRFEYAAPAQLVAELERNIRLDENILKFLTIKLDDAAPTEETAATTAEEA